MEKTLYIVVAWYGSDTFILQYRGVLSRFFHNNSPRVFKTLQTAIKNARKVGARYLFDKVKVFSITEGEEIDIWTINKWNRNETERISFTLNRKS